VTRRSKDRKTYEDTSIERILIIGPIVVECLSGRDSIKSVSAAQSVINTMLRTRSYVAAAPMPMMSSPQVVSYVILS
jgi:hypothetical protein